ncbi:isoprenylcysteine carboxylmethyltransferase family protein [Chitinophaga agrisoli]|uniref:Isoprenylcysteine carboxylmethyltransferase family protein n=1 Tax=Chitinophaga agrisoli TaxID=2607653 RepID=A0A5B2VR67_9BACT|nr:isoprenylcysteine carboxylmethyltransferase family protein [Chitinophaga agrisoli]KAA2241535.1 isoprenylcysteine carboxylmethyltransferase family protein [Chitinophaga agrisoli]
MQNIFYIVYLGWVLSEVILNRVLRAGQGDKKPEGKHSLTYIWVTAIIATVAAQLIARHTYFPLAKSAFVGITGLVLILLGMAFRFVAIASLGRFFTVNVAIREGHTIKKDGMYRLIRHPAYTGSLLSFLGFGVSVNNWISLVVAFVPVVVVFLYRIQIEEEMLTAGLGGAYEEYKRGTYRLIPWVY